MSTYITDINWSAIKTMALFLQVILPIFAVFASGFVLQRIRILDIRAVAAVTLYILSPALVFSSLYTADFNRDYVIIIIYMFVLFYFMVVLNKVLAKIFRWEKKTESASILATGFMNSGNYGLPVVLFSIGEHAIPYAIFIMTIQSLQNNFFGIYYASRGTSSVGYALLNVFKMPVTYAAILAFIFHYFQIPIGESVLDTISLVGNAAIPVMMIVLGMQLGSMMKITSDWQVLISGVTLKMIIAPVIAFLFVLFVPMDPVIGMVLIIISAMPTAATTTMYAIEFDTEPELVSTMTFLSTVISIFTISILLNILL